MNAVGKSVPGAVVAPAELTSVEPGGLLVPRFKKGTRGPPGYRAEKLRRRDIGCKGRSVFEVTAR
jgi:hypothetical protein